MNNSLGCSSVELFLHTANETIAKYAAKYLSQSDDDTACRLIDPETSDSMQIFLLRCLLNTFDPLMTTEEQTLFIPFLEYHLFHWQNMALSSSLQDIKSISENMVYTLNKFSQNLVCADNQQYSPVSELLHCSQIVMEEALFEWLDSYGLHELIRHKQNSVIHATAPALLCRHLSISSCWTLTVLNMLENLESHIPVFENQKSKILWISERLCSTYEMTQDICGSFQNAMYFEKENTGRFDA